MPVHFLDRFTPRAYPRTRIFSAAIVWSAVGVFLVVKGWYFFRGGSLGALLATLSVGTILGILKSRFVLDRVARKIIQRIGAKPARACLGGLFSVRNWLLITVMIVFGRTLGALPLNVGVKMELYVMVGIGLICSSRLLWDAWKKSPVETL